MISLGLLGGVVMGFIKNRAATVATSALSVVGGSKIKLIAIVVVITILAAGALFIKHKINTLQSDLIIAQQTIGSLNTTISAFELSIKAQNEKVQELHDLGEKSKNKILAKQKEARDIIKKYESDINKIMAQKISESCEAGIEWLKEKSAKELQW